MSLKTSEKRCWPTARSSAPLSKLCVDLCKTSIERKQMIEKTVKHRTILRSIFYKLHKCSSDEVCDCIRKAKR